MPPKSSGFKDTSTATIGFEATALRDSASPQSKSIPQVVSAAKNNMVALPGQFFYSTQIPVCLWFLAKSKNADAKRGFRDRRQQILVNLAEPAFTNFSNN